jgi:hypothetical protein
MYFKEIHAVSLLPVPAKLYLLLMVEERSRMDFAVKM